MPSLVAVAGPFTAPGERPRWGKRRRSGVRIPRTEETVLVGALGTTGAGLVNAARGTEGRVTGPVFRDSIPVCGYGMEWSVARRIGERAQSVVAEKCAETPKTGDGYYRNLKESSKTKRSNVTTRRRVAREWARRPSDPHEQLVTSPLIESQAKPLRNLLGLPKLRRRKSSVDLGKPIPCHLSSWMILVHQVHVGV